MKSTASPLADTFFLIKNGEHYVGNVVRVVMKDGRPAGLEDFVTGFLKDGVVMGRPAGLATGADGALYISDDNKGFIYRVAYAP